MWQIIMDRMPSGLGAVCTVLTVAIPYTVYKINQKLHELGDPAWKKEESTKDNN